MTRESFVDIANQDSFVVLTIHEQAHKSQLQSSSHALILCSSSLALTMAEQLDIIEGISDDMSIAQGLLARPIIPLRRRTSFTSTTGSGHIVEVSNEGNDSTGTKDEGRRRRMVQSSNTWTTSSGEALSELDDVDDRTLFVNEYNRLATKVCGYPPRVPS